MPEANLVKCWFCAEEILADAKKCKHCGEWVKSINPGTIKSDINVQNINNKKTSPLNKQYGLAGWGVILILIGGSAAIYFGLFFDTSVEVPTTELLGQTIGGGRVNNLGLMQDRQNFLMISCVATIIGVIMSIAGSKNK